MKLTFKEINNDEDIKALSVIAAKIWREYYPPIIGADQVEYMLDLMYSFKSLKKQIREDKNIFTAAYLDGRMAGFISISHKGDKNYFLHKLYIDNGIQKKGIGKALLNKVFSKIDYETIRLTVNRQNINAVNFYFKNGFKIERVMDMDIGGGYVMNDFVMVFSK
ncbi:MAG: GNAT family N-acetyltransferase [Bacteroidetes bacterium]|nr:GNAT family N-acetyltransferase [Bacteroidota bacterium]